MSRAATANALLRRLLMLLFLLAAVQAAFGASQLPALSAAWFDLRGEPVLFLPTWQIMWTHVLLAGALVAAFWIGPERWVDVPRTERRPDPRDALLRLAAWLGILTLLALTALMQLVYDANRRPIPTLEPRVAGALVGGYGLFVAFWGWAWRRTRRSALQPGGLDAAAGGGAPGRPGGSATDGASRRPEGPEGSSERPEGPDRPAR
jgi:hypothetical protein